MLQYKATNSFCLKKRLENKLSSETYHIEKDSIWQLIDIYGIKFVNIYKLKNINTKEVIVISENLIDNFIIIYDK